MSRRPTDRGDEYGGEFPPEVEPAHQYEASIAESALISSEEQATTVQKDQLIISLLEVQFPPPGLEWLKDFERNPDGPLKKSYRNGILLAEVDTSAPVIKVGISFLAGADKPSVTKAELSKVSDAEPFQKSPEWRVFTAATLLNRFEVGDDLLINQKDDSAGIVQRKRQSTGPPHDRDQSTFSRFLGRQSTEDQGGQESREIIRRNVQDHTLTIDSDEVKLLHGFVSVGHKFDITCTLVEIDMFSMRDLMMNYRTIVQSGGRNVSAKDILIILDTMINDVRRLCTRSPRLFRMATRSLIANSVDTRYGVDYGTNFATLTTSAGIRKLIDKSSAYYLSLNDSQTDQDNIKPKFLQMLVLLLSFLNNDDLKKISRVLESTFQIPGDRANLELLIMKVLPLASISPEVFLESLYDAYKPVEERKLDYGYSFHAPIWEELQQDLAAKGYIIPVQIEGLGSARLISEDTVVAIDLEDELADMDLEDPDPNIPAFRGQRRPPVPQRNGSWRAPWPRQGISMSTIFKYLQHDGLLRGNGDSKQGTVRAMNDIPHLEVTSEDHDNKLLAWFTNKKMYRLNAEDPDLISDMKEGTYVLSSLDNDAILSLDIASTVLNKPFMEATRELNILVAKIKGFFGGRVQRQGGALTRVLSTTAPSVASFAPVDEPPEAKWLWAEIFPPTGDRQRVAEVFKMGNKVVYRDDILRDMNSSLSKLSKAVNRLQAETAKFGTKKLTDEGKRQQQEVAKCAEMIGSIKRLMLEAEAKRKELQTIHRQYPEDPITKIIYPSFAQTHGEKREWQNYQTQLKKGGEHLIVKSKKLIVESTYSGQGQDQVLELSFVNSGLKLCVEPLTPASGADAGPGLGQGDALLWMGYYVVLVEPVEGVKGGQSVLGYFRVRSQRVEAYPAGGRAGESGLKDVISVLV